MPPSALRAIAPPAASRRPRCFYWVCAGIVMDVYDKGDAKALDRVKRSLACAEALDCRRAADCQEIALAALARLLERRAREVRPS